MQVNVKIHGLEMAKARLAEVNRQIEPVLRGAQNTTATKVRTERYVKPMGRVFYDKAFLRRRMIVKRAGRRRTDARVIPSSSGIPIIQWPGWKYSVITPTRGRIFIRTLKGRKLAAGFVNPSGRKGLPLRTRGFKGANGKSLKPALGPSVAYFFKQLTDSQTIRWTNGFLQQEFERRIKREVAKGAR